MKVQAAALSCHIPLGSEILDTETALMNNSWGQGWKMSYAERRLPLPDIRYTINTSSITELKQLISHQMSLQQDNRQSLRFVI